jgi:hypothetical protein
MTTDKEPQTPSELLDRLNEFLMERPEESVEELRARLKGEGVDPDRVIQRVRQLVDTTMKRSRLAWREKARQERLGLAEGLASVRSFGQWTREQMLARARDILAGSRGVQPANAHFRNFERMTDEDLRSLLEDFERTAAMEKREQPGSEEQGDAGNEKH